MKLIRVYIVFSIVLFLGGVSQSATPVSAPVKVLRPVIAEGFKTLARDYLAAFQQGDLQKLKAAVTSDFYARMGDEKAVTAKFKSAKGRYRGSKIQDLENRVPPDSHDSAYFRFSIKLSDGTTEWMPWMSCVREQGKWKIDLTLNDFEPEI